MRDAIDEKRVSDRALAGLLDDPTSVLVEHCRLSEVVDAEPSGRRETLVLESLDVDPEPNEQEPWLVLVGFSTRGFRAIIDIDRRRAEAIVQRWWLVWQTTGFALFARLWLWGAARCPSAPVEPVMEWLRADERRLWADEWEREVTLFVIERARDLLPETFCWLVEAIASGRGLPDELRNRPQPVERRDRLLAALQRSQAAIPEEFRERSELALGRIAELDRARLQDLPEPRADEVGPLRIQIREIRRRDRIAEVDTMSPPDIAAAVGTMPADVENDPGAATADAVRRSSHPPSAIAKALLERGEDRLEVWRGFWFGLVHDNPAPERDFEALVDLVQQQPTALPDDALVAHGWWLETVAGKELDPRAHEIFLRAWDFAWRRAGEEAHQAVGGALDLTAVINSEAGALAEALIDRLSACKPGRGAKFPPWFVERAGSALGPCGRSRQLATIRLAADLSFLFVIDPEWTKDHFLPFFDPSRSSDLAVAVWDAWLHAPRRDADLTRLVAPCLVNMAGLASQLSDRTARWFAELFLRASMEQPASFPRAETVEALRQLGPELLAHAVGRLAGDLEAADDKAAGLWHEYVGPWFRNYWPGEKKFREGPVCAAANRVLLHTREAFPEALATLRELGLVHSNTGDENERRSLFQTIAKSLDGHGRQSPYSVADQFPNEFVSWLDAIVGPGQPRDYHFDDIRKALEKLPKGTPGSAALLDKLR